MKKIARNHHYVPQGYLAAFTNTGLKDGQLFVLDLETGNSFRTSPKNVAVKRDFNRVDVEGKPPDVLEQALSPIEAKMIDACRKVNLTKSFPNDEDYNSIINLLGLLAVKNPKFRSSFNKAREHGIRIMNSILVSNEEIFTHHLNNAIEAGELDEEDRISHKEFIKDQDFDIEFTPEGNLRVEHNAFDGLLPLLGERKWSLFLSPDNGPCFICSDHPVVLSRKNSKNKGSIGYGLKNTEIFFPLGPKTGLFGVYEDPLPPVIIVGDKKVAIMNRRIAMNAERQVYSRMDKFIVWGDGKINYICFGSNI